MNLRQFLRILDTTLESNEINFDSRICKNTHVT